MEALARASHNPDEIVLREDDEDEEQEIEASKMASYAHGYICNKNGWPFILEVQLEQKAVPTEVFGGIGGEEGQVMGAKERLSRKRKK